MSAIFKKLAAIGGEIIGNEKTDPCEPCSAEPSPTLDTLVRGGWEIKKRMEADAEALKAINDKLLELLPVGGAVEIPGAKVQHIERTTLEIVDVPKLASALGPRFTDLVDTKTKYGVTDKLEELAFSGDGGVIQEQIRASIQVKTSRSITYRATKV